MFLKGELLMGEMVLHGEDGGGCMAQLQRWKAEAGEWKSIQIQGSPDRS